MFTVGFGVDKVCSLLICIIIIFVQFNCQQTTHSYTSGSKQLLCMPLKLVSSFGLKLYFVNDSLFCLSLLV